MKRMLALFLVVLALTAFAGTASAKIRGEVVWGLERAEWAQTRH